MANRFIDNVITLRILRLLTQKWTDSAAFKNGVIDSSGKILVKPTNQTISQKNSYSKLDVLCWNLKKLIEKLPFGKRTISKYIIALRLIQEESGNDLAAIKSELSLYIKETCEFEELNSSIIEELFEDGSVAGAGAGASVGASMGSGTGIGGAVSNVTSGIDNPDQVLGQKKKRKPEQFKEYQPDDHFSGHPVFDVKDEHMMTSRMGKRKFLKYSTYVGKDEQGEKIRSYSRSNPKKNIILRNSNTGSMMYLRKLQNVGQ